MVTDSPPANAAPSAVNLRRLVSLRNIAILGQTATVLVAVYGLGMALPLAVLAAIIGGLALANLLTWLRLKAARPVSEAELFGQLLLDTFALTLLLYFSGGSTNPFVLLYLLPITLTAAALPGSYTWLMAAVTAGCYSWLMFFFVPLPHVHAAHGSEFDLHVVGMWLGFVLSAWLIAYFVTKMAGTLRERDRTLAALREVQLHNERVLALGTLAAGAAHELGTPLSTMAVLVKEMEGEAGNAGSRGKLAILREQVNRCKQILSSLSASAGQPRAESGRSLPLDVYLEELLAQWQAMRPGVHVVPHADGSRPAPQILTEQTLSQAIVSLLNNAADVSPENIEVDAHWSDRELRLEVRDRGPGLAPGTEQAAGTPFFTTKEPGQGLGLGLFLAQATLRRLGGSIKLNNRDDGGACATLALPLAGLSVGTSA